jgi:hypothetical protein
MTSPLPLLELADAASPFDEALLLIDGHEEETIRIECEGAQRLAERIAAIVNNHELVIKTLIAAGAALRASELGTNVPEIARAAATDCEQLSLLMGVLAA